MGVEWVAREKAGSISMLFSGHAFTSRIRVRRYRGQEKAAVGHVTGLYSVDRCCCYCCHCHVVWRPWPLAPWDDIIYLVLYVCKYQMYIYMHTYIHIYICSTPDCWTVCMVTCLASISYVYLSRSAGSAIVAVYHLSAQGHTEGAHTVRHTPGIQRAGIIGTHTRDQITWEQCSYSYTRITSAADGRST